MPDRRDVGYEDSPVRRRRSRRPPRSPPAVPRTTPHGLVRRPSQEAKNRKAMLDYARCMRENGVDMPDPKFEGGRVIAADRARPSPDNDARGREGVREVPRRRSRRRRSPTRSRRSSRRRRWPTRAACASTASTSPTRVRRERRGADPARQRASNPDVGEVQGGAEGVRETLPERPEHDRRAGGGREVMKRATRRRRRARGRRRGRRGAWRPAAKTPVARRPPAPARATATVERTDLVDRESISGTLGYADPGTLARRRRGHADRAARPGHGRHPRALALRRRRRAGRVPVLRR